jgi:hypothetical protein
MLEESLVIDVNMTVGFLLSVCLLVLISILLKIKEEFMVFSWYIIGAVMEIMLAELRSLGGFLQASYCSTMQARIMLRSSSSTDLSKEYPMEWTSSPTDHQNISERISLSPLATGNWSWWRCVGDRAGDTVGLSLRAQSRAMMPMVVVQSGEHMLSLESQGGLHMKQKFASSSLMYSSM